jgi:hypothetical protein
VAAFGGNVVRWQRADSGTQPVLPVQSLPRFPTAGGRALTVIMDRVAEALDDDDARTHWPPRSSRYVVGDDRPPLRVDFLVSGETCWASNELRFLDDDDAVAFARGLCDRWIVVDRFRVVPQDWPVHERYRAGSGCRAARI